MNTHRTHIRNTLKTGSVFLFTILMNLPFTLSGQTGRDLVHGNLIQFNDNGAWCWYQDERVVIDAAGGKLITGSDASSSGIGGNGRSGNVEAVVFDLETRRPQLSVLRRGGGQFYCDDHNAPAFLVRPDGKILSMYAAHFGDTSSYYRIYNNSEWGPENEFDWTDERPGGANFQTTYSNLYYLSEENHTYNFVRGNNKSPNSMISDDQGDTWSYGGQLTRGSNVGYNNGYYKYSGNGTDRIDFLFTEYHPRDYNTSIFHGYIQDGKSYKSDGTLVDASVFKNDLVPIPADFTTVFEAGTIIGSMTMYRCWNADVQFYEDGSIAALITARINNNTGGNDSGINPDHAFIYCRFNGMEWVDTYLGQAGKKMYGSEADYTGLGALCPDDPHTIYISTHIDPRSDEDITFREIFKGVTGDNGATWTWTPVTEHSTRHNFRPIVPKWDEHHTALLWFRGIYNAAQNYDAAIVGIIESDEEQPGKPMYIDADLQNTTLADGSAPAVTGPGADKGASDNRWHIRTGYGNGETVLTSSENNGENAPVLRTRVNISEPGTYDVWADFWGNPADDWRIKAGLDENNMQMYRSKACRQVEQGDHDAGMELSEAGDLCLYQAYLGRINLDVSGTLDVFIDDFSIRTGTSSTSIASSGRTWYDGVSTASLETDPAAVEGTRRVPSVCVLSQNYPNPFNPSTRISYSVMEPGQVTLKIFNSRGQEIRTLVSEVRTAGNYQIEFNAEGLSNGIYYYRLKAGDHESETQKMVLIR